jgi:sulfotransferase family protein
VSSATKSQDPLAQLAEGPIFIGGHGRSGTTWVYDVLCAHEEVGGVFESQLFYPRVMGGVFARVEWNSDFVADRAHTFGRGFGLHQMISREQLVEDIRELAGRWMARALQPNDRYLVEKTPAHLERMDLIAEVFPDARFVHVIRDGRDVALSMRAAASSWMWSAKVGHPFFYRLARRWNATIEAISKAGARRPERYLEVRYEDLHADPLPTLRTLFGFCRIPHDDGTLSDIIKKTEFDSHTVRGEDSFRRRGNVGDWREEFGPLRALAFQRAAGDMLMAKGYEASSGWWLRQLPIVRHRGRHAGAR